MIHDAPPQVVKRIIQDQIKRAKALIGELNGKEKRRWKADVRKTLRAHSAGGDRLTVYECRKLLETITPVWRRRKRSKRRRD